MSYCHSYVLLVGEVRVVRGCFVYVRNDRQLVEQLLLNSQMKLDLSEVNTRVRMSDDDVQLES